MTILITITASKHNLFQKIQPHNKANLDYINGLMQDYSNSIADALELLQSCTKPSIWGDEHSNEL